MIFVWKAVFRITGCLLYTSEASVDASPDAGETTAAGGSYKIGVSLMDYNMQFFQDMLAAMKAKAAELGVELVDFDSQQDAAKQLNDVPDMVNALQVAAIILNPVCLLYTSLPNILGNMDGEIADAFRVLAGKRMDIHTQAKVTKIEATQR